MPTVSAADAARMQGVLLDQTATVYTEGASGAFDNAVQSNLPCHLAPASGGRGASGLSAAERDELAARRTLYWSLSYTMPEHAQLGIGSERWNILTGTLVRRKIVQAADVLRASEAL